MQLCISVRQRVSALLSGKSQLVTGSSEEMRFLAFFYSACWLHTCCESMQADAHHKRNKLANLEVAYTTPPAELLSSSSILQCRFCVLGHNTSFLSFQEVDWTSAGKMCGHSGETLCGLAHSFAHTHTHTHIVLKALMNTHNCIYCLQYVSAHLSVHGKKKCDTEAVVSYSLRMCTSVLLGLLTASVLERDKVRPFNESRTDTLTFSQAVVCLRLNAEDHCVPISLFRKGSC